jgi:ATP-binding protein involved in chromosome partitioning
MAKPDFDAVLNALRSVNDLEEKQDLVTLKRVKDIKVFDQGRVSVNVLVKSMNSAHNADLKGNVVSAIKKVLNVESVDVFLEEQGKQVQKPAAPQNSARGIPGVLHIIAVSSGKGGVGKSTVSVNLATSLALEGKKVGLLDADIYGPNLPTMMGVTDNPKLIQDPVKGEMFIPPVSHGVKVMSMGFLLQGDQPVIWRGPMLHNILNQFCTKIEWGTLDYLVIDLPPGTGDVQLSLAQMLPISGAVIVTTPQEIALQDVRKALNMWEKVRVPTIGIVENMSYFRGDDNKEYRIFGEGGGEMLARKFNSKLLAQMPLVADIRKGGDEGKPIVIREPGSEAATLFRDLSCKVMIEVNEMAAKSKATPDLEIGNF